MKKIYIEISDICGLKCSFCPVPKGIRGVMDLELFKKAVAESAHYTNLIALHILGDPLCVENLSYYLAVAKSANLKVEITTSGVNLANLTNFDLLLNAPIKQVNFSLDALMELKNKELLLELLLARIVEFCKYKKAIKSQIFVNLRVQKRARNRDLVAFLEREFDARNLGQYLDDSQICDSRVKLGERVIIDFRSVFEWSDLKNPPSLAEGARGWVKPDNIHNQNPPPLSPSAREGEQVDSTSARNGKTNESPQNEFAIKGTCLALKSHIGILSNGEIVPCCMDSQGVLSLGNINDTTLDSALKSQKAQKMLNGFRKNRILEPFCKACDYRKRFTKI
ncbi:radical SAM/SPASM domain-containing protein [Helicobacter sp. 23-1044]